MIEKKFIDDLNTAVFTTKNILEKSIPILKVIHHQEDGAWEFRGNEINLKDEDYRVISLEEIIKIDSSILDVADLALGMEAMRKDKNALWYFSGIV